MTTVTSKCTRKEVNDPALTIMKGSTLTDDMEIIRKICLPEKTAGKSRSNASHLTFGLGDQGPVKSTNQADFQDFSSAGATEDPDVRAARALYMREKHFPMGYNEEPMQTESRAIFVPHGRQKERKIFNIGAPHNKTASNVYAGKDELDNWKNDVESTNKLDFVHPRQPKPPKINHALAHGTTHFTFGQDKPDTESYTRACYKGPGPDYERAVPVQSAVSSVQFGSKDFPWAKQVNSTTRADYCQPFVADEDSLTNFVQNGPPFTFGDDPREMLTENRGSYKKTQFLDCTGLSNEQLTMLGVTREQVIPRKVPLPFLSCEVFKNCLGQPHMEG
mmetsp:Transcript_35842/g.64026  ORF Transcript_35842/g.64026 Transcript_35842/m.64026 type:complete len:333 (-) Transcript_35842:591-1589(-)